jgi:SAM-dependent methyltransferase
MAFFERGGYARRWLYYAGGRDRTVLQKVLEHWTAAELLGLEPSDLYLDVASQDSPAPDIYARLYACRVLRQDLGYRAGLHGGRIGGSAESIPLPTGSVSKMALHNAFEHFEADADTGFVHEAQRLLRPGGRLCILPLFLHPTYSVQTDLAMLPPGVELRFDAGARIHEAPGWRDRHGRFYDVPQLIRRVVQPARQFRLRLIHYENAAELYPGCHMHYAALFERTSDARGRDAAVAAVAHSEAGGHALEPCDHLRPAVGLADEARRP